MLIYVPRMSRPLKGNEYYNTKTNNGWSNAIVGKVGSTGKSDPDCNVLANCVGYVHGRFHEIAGNKNMNYISPVNAEDIPEYARNMRTGTVPKLGSIIVWRKGNLKNSKDGAGHVAIVEKIISDKQIIISQSGYENKVFWTEICTKSGNEWKCSWMGSAYKFRTFIYNPSVPDNIRTQLTTGDTGIYVKELQNLLNLKFNANLVEDGSFGNATTTFIKSLQKENNLTIDGIVGEKTWAIIESTIIPADNTKVIYNGKSYTARIKDDYIRIKDLISMGIIKFAELKNKDYIFK